MNDQLRSYIAFNGGVKVMQHRSGSTSTVGEFFEGRTVDALCGLREHSEVVFAAVALDGGYRTQDGGRT